MKNLERMTTIIPWTDRINSTPVLDLRAAQDTVAHATGYFAEAFKCSQKTLDDLLATNEFTKFYREMVARKGSSCNNIKILLEMMFGRNPILEIDEELSYGEVLVTALPKHDFNGAQVSYIGCS